MSIYQATLWMFLGAFFWGTNPALIKLIDWSPLGISWVRSLFCASVLLLFILYKKRFSTKDIGLQLLSGFFLAANSFLFVAASTHTSPANAVVLLFVFPWVTLSLDFFLLRKKPDSFDFLRLVLGFVGVIVIVSGGLSSSNVMGDLIALCAGFTIAFHIFISQRLEEKYSGDNEVLSAILLGWLLSIIVLMPFGLSEPYPQAFNIGSSQFYLLIIFGLLSAIPWLFWSMSVAFVPGHILAALLGIEVFVAALFGWWLLNITLGIETWLGGLLTLFAATWQIVASANKQKSV
jgi:drug/metabolite transporter (DMT)-like permease